MGRFGEDLRGARERQGLSLEAISWSTKISQRYLEALETGQYQGLPGGVFRRGFLRSYLRALGLPESEWLTRFDEELRLAGVSDSAGEDFTELARNVALARGGRLGQGDGRLRWSGVLAMLALLLVFGWCVWHFALSGHVRLANGEAVPPVWSRALSHQCSKSPFSVS